MDNTIETPEKYTELFILLNQEYITSACESENLSKCDKRNHLFHVGWKILIHLFKKTRYMQRTIKDTYTIIQKSRAIYTEYMEQIITEDADNIDFSNTFNFIYRKAFDFQEMINSELSINIPDEFLDRIIKIMDTLMMWYNDSFTIENRKDICDRLLQSYILLFTTDEKIQYIYMLEFLIEKLNFDKTVTIDEYSCFLTDYYFFVVRKKNDVLTESDINNMYLNKYYSQMDKFDKLFIECKKEKNFKAFIKWLFSSSRV
jgi:hypothetical protein